MAAWIMCAELQAAAVPAGTFDKGKVGRGLNDIRVLSTRDPAEFVPELKGILARNGVVLVLLPRFPKPCARGATFWIKPDKAVLLMSPRACWTDISWFSLFHGIGHILLHGKRVFIDERKVSPELARQEREADYFAKDSLVGAGL